MNDCAANQEAGLSLKMLNEVEPVVGPDYFDANAKMQASVNDINEAHAEKEKAKAHTGIIVNSQLANESHVNTGAGARLGAAYSQARYIDHSSVGNYSATKQLGQGLVGAIIGGALLDKPTTTSYRATYFVKFSSGDIKQIDVTSSTPTHIPEGVCVEAYDNYVEIVNQNNCAGLSVSP